MKLYYINAKVIPTITYAFPIVPYLDTELHALDNRLAKSVKLAYGLPQSYSTQLIQDDRTNFGLGFPSIKVKYAYLNTKYLTYALQDTSLLGSLTIDLLHAQNARLQGFDPTTLHFFSKYSLNARRLALARSMNVTLFTPSLNLTPLVPTPHPILLIAQSIITIYSSSHIPLLINYNKLFSLLPLLPPINNTIPLILDCNYTFIPNNTAKTLFSTPYNPEVQDALQYLIVLLTRTPVHPQTISELSNLAPHMLNRRFNLQDFHHLLPHFTPAQSDYSHDSPTRRRRSQPHPSPTLLPTHAHTKYQRYHQLLQQGAQPLIALSTLYPTLSPSCILKQRRTSTSLEFHVQLQPSVLDPWALEFLVTTHPTLIPLL
jgi:hypothetical protein